VKKEKKGKDSKFEFSGESHDCELKRPLRLAVLGRVVSLPTPNVAFENIICVCVHKADRLQGKFYTSVIRQSHPEPEAALYGRKRD
jgi:hypothetical protein